MTEKFKDIRVVIFDLYGTLIHPATEAKVYSNIFTDIGLNNPKELKEARIIALTEDFDSLTSLVKKLKPRVKIDIKKYEQELKLEINSTRPYPEVTTVLRYLIEKNIKLGLISNLASSYKSAFARSNLTEYFNNILFSCDIGLKKPDSRIYNIMIKQFQIIPSQALMIGDNIYTDVAGPKAIGMNAIHLDRNKLDSDQSDNSIKSLDEIFKYI